MIMLAIIRPSADLRSNYKEIVNINREQKEPVFITKNSHEDAVVMSMELYNQLVGRQELYGLLDVGMDAIKNGQVRHYREAMVDIRQQIEAQ